MIKLVLELIFITSILVLGYTIFTQNGMGGYGIRLWAQSKKSKGAKWAEPLFLCHYCQPSTWSFIAFGMAYGLGLVDNFTWNLLLLYPLCVGGSSLVNGIAWSIHEIINAEKEYYYSATNLADAQLENVYDPDFEEEDIFNLHENHN